ncbi:MAG TPA: cytochrome c maturation protein CcmE [Solirubrobacteraceae bacterium]|nr:cytochrome c maturation protein CcmE [Solirubrobacteraceae bacterium]
MTPRRRRLVLVLGILAGVSIAGALALSAFRQNVTFYFIPSQVAQGSVRPGQEFRLGGLVEKGTVSRAPGSMEVHFTVTDFKHQIPVVYSGVLPDLFREGAGVIARGQMLPNGTFQAEEVLAKHDQYYRPPGIGSPKLDTRHGEPRDAALQQSLPTASAALPQPAAEQQ